MPNEDYFSQALRGYEPEYAEIEEKVVKLEVLSTYVATRCGSVKFGKGGGLLDELDHLREEATESKELVDGVNKAIEDLGIPSSGVDEDIATKLDNLNRRANVINEQIARMSNKLEGAKEKLLKNSFIAQMRGTFKDTFDQVKDLVGRTAMRLIPVIRKVLPVIAEALEKNAPALNKKLQGWFQRLLQGGK